ncbi:hypothetical protein EIP91_001106 [Steccherinum ochraceum]|uniref:Uncharacterized protein n=1 Tax=Steccherinum ochraceum TaxID=92696 RepID=A0A4R0RN36_9APHY|nr:hypothetical protein EIP91_001106 [Steccherinum ochraceum]
MPLHTDASICVLGAGPVGLVTAHTLLQDGFENIAVLTRDRSPGGVWAEERLYPDVMINNVHGEYRFSSLPMPPPTNISGRLTGENLRSYFQTFADRFLAGKIRFNTEVESIRRGKDGGWEVAALNLDTKETSTVHFDKGCSEPKIPEELSPLAAKRTGFIGPVVHSNHLTPNLKTLLDAVKPSDEVAPGHALVIGGGKSAAEFVSTSSRSFTGRKVTMVFSHTDSFLATAKPLPAYIRKSRLLSLLSPYKELRTWPERLLHGTLVGSLFIEWFWSMMTSDSFKAMNVPDSSPLHNTHDLFWSVHSNDEGIPDPNRFHALVNAGKIEIIAPARVVGYSESSSTDASGSPTVTVETADGQRITANAVVVCTGYESSWTKLFDDETRADLGLDPVPVPPVDDLFNYPTLSHPPPLYTTAVPQRVPLYRGLVPAKNILNRDFAMNGTTYSTNFCYTAELHAHWISSYFLGDPFLKIPPSPEEARRVADEWNMWWRKRYPHSVADMNEVFGGGFPFLNWPQAADMMLEDMDLPSGRSGGNWLTWPFQVIDSKEIEHLHEERAAKRMQYKD